MSNEYFFRVICFVFVYIKFILLYYPNPNTKQYFLIAFNNYIKNIIVVIEIALASWAALAPPVG